MMTEQQPMWAHALHYITICSQGWPTPYWLCAKCGERNSCKPDRHGCNVEK